MRTLKAAELDPNADWVAVLRTDYKGTMLMWGATNFYAGKLFAPDRVPPSGALTAGCSRHEPEGPHTLPVRTFFK